MDDAGCRTARATTERVSDRRHRVGASVRACQATDMRGRETKWDETPKDLPKDVSQVLQ